MTSKNLATASLTVGDEHTAIGVGSGDVAVLATPCLVAICEQATVAAVAEVLGSGETSVGVHIDIEHLAASAVGSTVIATAEIRSINGRQLTCSVEAHEGSKLVGRGTVVRLRVDRDRFMERLRTT